MGVGAYRLLTSSKPSSLKVNILVWIIASGLVSALVGVLFGLPSLRIKGFYLAVATLAAQFFLQWCFARVPWLVNYNDLRARSRVPTQTLFGLPGDRPDRDAGDTLSRYADDRRRPWPGLPPTSCTGGLDACGWRCATWTLRQKLIGIRLLRAKLLAFAVSSFYVGVAGAMMVFIWFGAANPRRSTLISPSRSVHDHHRRTGLSRSSAAFLAQPPSSMLGYRSLRAVPAMVGLSIDAARIDQLTLMITGALIIAT